MTSKNPFSNNICDEAAIINREFKFCDDSLHKEEDKKISLEMIADYLLEKHLLLSALELYTESLEHGTELIKLKHFFSNPMNFEIQLEKESFNSGSLKHVESMSSLGSLDITQSEDGKKQVDERVAVLEFELRKANETIKSLRSNLTDLTERGKEDVKYVKRDSDPNGFINESADNEAKPLECRAINYLVNQYLLTNHYKLSSITFCEENSSQDFEDWHDVGLNIPKPPNLLTLYRNNIKREKNEDLEIENDNEKKESFSWLHHQINCLRNDKDELVNKNSELIRELNECKLAERKVNGVHVVDVCVQTGSEIKQEELKNDEEGTKQKEIATTCDRWVPLEFWKKLINETIPCDVEEIWLKEEVNNICTSPTDLVGSLARCVPHILPIVLLAKRDRLLPLLLGAASLHHSPQTRNSLLNLLFNLIKKPDQSQRQMILQGCVSYAKHVGKERTEEELLPQCWEQIGHKHPERRQLIAETCGAISPYLSSEIRSSLLLSILLQILQEEKLREVKLSAIKSLAIVFTFLSGDEKYKMVEDCFWKLYDDEEVCDAIFVSLFPSFSLFSITVNRFCCDFGEQVLNRVKEEFSVDDKLSKSNRGLKEINLLKQFIPLLLSHTLKLFMLSEEDEKQQQEFLASLSSKSAIKPTEDIKEGEKELTNPCIILGVNENRLQSLKNELNESLNNEDCEDTNDSDEVPVLPLKWIQKRFLPTTLDILPNLPARNVRLIESFIEIFIRFSQLFGERFLQKVLLPSFMDRLNSNKSLLTSSLLPVLVVGVMAVKKQMSKEETGIALHKFLFTTLETLSECNLSIDSLRTTFIFLREESSNHKMLIQVLVSASVHPSEFVKRSAAFLIADMSCDDVSSKIISSCILPTLIELSVDDSTKVRLATLFSFASLTVNRMVTSDAVDRVICQLRNMMTWSTDEEDGNMLGLFSVKMEIIEIATKIGSSVHPKFRNEFLLPHLAIISASNNQLENSMKRSQICFHLLTAYTNLLCCFIDSSTLQGSCLPGLKCVLADMIDLHPDETQSVKELIADIEQKLKENHLIQNSNK